MTDIAERLHEQLLVIRCQAGDEDAFAELVAVYHPRLRYYLRRMLPNEDHADDVLQEVWLAVFRALPRLADPAALATWLYRIARDKASVQWRGRPPECGLMKRLSCCGYFCCASEFRVQGLAFRG